MIDKKKLVEIKAEVVSLLGRLPGRSPHSWLDREIESAKRDRKRDLETLEMLCAALEHDASKRRPPKGRRKPATR